MEYYVEKQFVRAGNLQFHVITAGPEDGEPLLLLHGFPEFWYGWRKQIPYFADQGYRVIVPDQRGYNLSDKPADVSSYNIDLLATDVRNLLDTFAIEKVNLVGHDWGALVAWWTAILYPDRLKKLGILNVPHPVAGADVIRNSPAQLLRSGYIFFFNLPIIPENVLAFNNFDALIRALKESSTEGAFTEGDFEQYRLAWSQRDALSSMLNWYRALLRSSLNNQWEQARDLRISTPTLMLWGEQDVALGKELAQPSIEMCDDGELVFFPKASHWVQHDDPQGVNRLLHDFLQRQPQPVATV